MTKVMGVRLSYEGSEDAFLEAVHEIVRKVRDSQERDLRVLLDVRQVPVLIDPKLLYDACTIISASLEALDAVQSLTLLCNTGIQESLTRSTLMLIPTPWEVDVVTDAPWGEDTILQRGVNP